MQQRLPISCEKWLGRHEVRTAAGAKDDDDDDGEPKKAAKKEGGRPRSK